MQCVMARTLYSYVRVLPAYRLYRACRDHRGAAHNLSYRLLHTAAPALQPADTGNRPYGAGPRAHVERFAFAPIETMTGSLQISVQYQPQVVPLMSSAAVPVSIPQHVITDYIRSPRASLAPGAVHCASSAVSCEPGTYAPHACLACLQAVESAWCTGRCQRLRHPRWAPHLGEGPRVPPAAARLRV
jgi:Autophagy-related protein 13